MPRCLLLYGLLCRSSPRYHWSMETTSASGQGEIPAVIGEHIEITPGVCGGRPRVRGHRIKVQHIAVWHERMGLSPDEILSQHPGLTLGDVHAALAYYWDHRAQIDADIKADRDFAETLRGDAPDIFEKVRQRKKK